MKHFRTCTLLLALLMLLTGLLGAVAETGIVPVDAANGETAGITVEDTDASVAAAEPAVDGAADTASAVPGDAANAEAIDTQAAGKPALYIVLIDCGATLYGTPFEKSVVTASGDPSGMLLSLVGTAPAALCSEDYIAVYGYNDSLISNGVRPLPMSDLQAIGTQVLALRSVSPNNRYSSDLGTALSSLHGIIESESLASKYDCRLVILTGGAINFFGKDASKNARKKLDEIAPDVSAIIDAGVSVTAFGYDLSASPALNTARDVKPDNLLLTEAQFPGAEYITTPVNSAESLDQARIKYCQKVLNWFAVQGGFEPSVRLEDVSKVGGGDVVVLWNPDANAYQAFTGNQLFGSVIEQINSGRASAMLCANPASSEGPTVGALYEALNLDSDWFMSCSPLMAGESFEIECSLNPNDFSVDSNTPDIVTATISNGKLTLEPKAEGKGELVFHMRGQEAPVTAFAMVLDYRLSWQVDDGASITIDGQPRTFVSTVQPVLGFELDLQTEAGDWAPVALDDTETASMQNSAGKLDIAIQRPGQYRLTAWVEDTSGNKVNEEVRTFTANIQFDELPAVTLKTPYFAEQPGQRIPLTVSGEPAPVQGYSAKAEPTGIADAYLDASQSSVYIVPKAAGKGRVAVCDASGEERLSIDVTVDSLTKQPLFWVFAAAIPVCLVGLTAMIVILISKLKRR